MDVTKALADIPKGLRTPLLQEYRSITANYAEHRWSPSALSGGKFCEIVYTILDGHAKGSYQAKPSKPKDFVSACRKLENNTSVPRSFQILIPRMLPALYEVRNNRGVGHAGGDVDPNHMDATLVISMCNWVMAELVRVFHGMSTKGAQSLVDRLSERRVPLIWQGANVKRILDPKMKLSNQVLLFLATSPGPLKTDDILTWTGYADRSYYFKQLRGLHKTRMLELSADESCVEILPPGSKLASEIVAKYQNKL